MGKRRSTLGLSILLSLAATAGGCNRHDKECLGNIGRKIMDRAGTATTEIRAKVHGWQGPGLGGVQDRVSLRLRWEKLLAEAAIQVVVNGKDIELKGTVNSAEERSRAVELAESTVGVERVLVSLTVGPPPAK